LRNSSRGSKLRSKRSAIVRRTSRKISFSPRKNIVTTSNKNKKIKNQPFIEEKDILVEEELPDADNLILDEEIAANPIQDNPLVPDSEVQEFAGEAVNNPVSKLKLFSLFLFFSAFLLLLFEGFVDSPLSELFWWWKDEFYQTFFIFPILPSL